MGKSIPVTIGDKHFSKKGDAHLYFKEILNRYFLGDTVSNPEHAFLVAALSKHPEYEEKTGAGISHFTIEKAPDHGTRCFWVNRIDGTKIDFSYKSCIN